MNFQLRGFKILQPRSVALVDGSTASYENLVLDENSKNLTDKFECSHPLFAGQC